jgi:hypothetical protein
MLLERTYRSSAPCLRLSGGWRNVCTIPLVLVIMRLWSKSATIFVALALPPPPKPDSYWLIERQRTAFYGTKSPHYGQPWSDHRGMGMDDREPHDDAESVDELRKKLDEVLRGSREQLSATAEMRQAVREIHHRIMSGGFPLLPRREGEGK